MENNMDNYWIILSLPIIFFLGKLIYQIINLIYLWGKFKLEDLKNIKEIF